MTDEEFKLEQMKRWELEAKRWESDSRETEARARGMRELNQMLNRQSRTAPTGCAPGMGVGGYPIGSSAIPITRTFVTGGTGVAPGLPQATTGGYLIIENPEALIPLQTCKPPPLVQEPEEEPRPTRAADEFSFIRRRQEELARQTMERVAKCDD